MFTRTLCAVAALALFAGCATNQRFTGDELPSGKLTGERTCEVPQNWKALALIRVNMQTLKKATAVQVRIPPELFGDTLGWFVENVFTDENGDTKRVWEHYPRITWQALVVDRHGKQQLFPVAMKNPLLPAPSQGVPVLTIIIPDGAIPAGEEVNVYVLSGAHTKLLTTGGEWLSLPAGKDCLGLVDAEFVRLFPSKATVLSAGESLLTSLRADFPRPSLQGDGVWYSHNLHGIKPQVSASLRQVNREERIGEQGAKVHPFDPLGTVIGIGVTLATTGSDEYTGPFGERSYSLGEAQAAIRHYLKGYNAQKERLEVAMGLPLTGSATIHLDFTGRKSGWEIGSAVAPQVQILWEALDQLNRRFIRATEKGRLK